MSTYFPLKPFKQTIDGKDLCCKCCGQHYYSIELIARLNYLRQAVKEKFGKDLIITSAYRCPAHNARVGGVKGSYHTKGMAADVKVEGIDSVELAIMAEQVGFTGIGIYNTFIHVDVREKPAKWYNKQPVDGKGEPQ